MDKGSLRTTYRRVLGDFVDEANTPIEPLVPCLSFLRRTRSKSNVDVLGSQSLPIATSGIPCHREPKCTLKIEPRTVVAYLVSEANPSRHFVAQNDECERELPMVLVGNAYNARIVDIGMA